MNEERVTAAVQLRDAGSSTTAIAVDALNGHCIVVMVRGGAVDLHSPQAGDQLAALLHTEHAVSAALPIVTNLAA